MKGIILRKATVFALLTILFFQFHSVEAQDSALKSIQKSTFSVEIDPTVPIVLHGFSGHLMWKPKNSNHVVYGLAIIVGGELPSFVINLNSKNKDMGWNYKINQGLGLEMEYYYKQANIAWFSGLQLFTQEINLTNDNVPSVEEHRTNTGMAVITTGYKWSPFKSEHFYIKPWAGIGFSGVLNGAFSSEVIPNTEVGSYTYHISPVTPYAAIHLGYNF
jgi:hypothetical protein